MSGGHASSGTAARYSAAAVHLVFQTRPGVAADRRITAGGTATVTLHSGAVLEVAPVDGIYHFDLPDGDEAVFELFGTQYRVVRADGMARDPGGERTIVVWSGTLRPITDPDGILQRLQILGYNTDPVDMNMSAGAERGVLEFQADNGLVIDGDAGPRTRTKLDEVFGHAGHMAGTTQPLNRRYLVFFERAAYGTTRRDSPQIDFRGGDQMELAVPVPMSALRHGPHPPQRYKVNCFPVNLDETSLPWHASMRSGGILTLENAIMTTYSDRLEFAVSAAGEDLLELRQGGAAGPIIASLAVKAVEFVQVHIWGHILTVQDTAGGTLADPPLWTETEAHSLMHRINDIWNPAGVRFSFTGFESHTITEYEAGLVYDDYIGRSYQSPAIARMFNRQGVMNVYFTQKLKQRYLNADGIEEVFLPIAHAGNRWHFHPSAVFTSKTEGLELLARVLAHEFGHMLRCTRDEHAHTDDRGVAAPWRHDLWSRMRLMSKYVNYHLDNPDRSWQDLTYGQYDENSLMAGDLISVKNLPHDGTDDDLAQARDSVGGDPHSQTGLPLPADA